MPTRRELLAAAGVGSVTLAGCTVFGDDGADRQVPADWQPGEGEWSNTRYGPGRTGYNPHADPPLSEPTEAWRIDPERGGLGVLVADGTVYRRRMRSLSAHDVEDGAEQWTVPLAGSGAILWYIDGRIYALSGGRLRALSPDSEELWAISGARGNALFEHGGYVYLAASTERITRYHADTGDELGTIDVDFRDFAAWNGTLFAAGADGVAAYTTEEGGDLTEAWRADDALTAEWQQDPGGPRTPSPSLAVADGTVYVVENGPGLHENAGRLLLLDADDGSMRRTVEFDRTVTGPVVGDDVYLAVARFHDDDRTEDGEVLAVDGGEPRWSVAVPAPVSLIAAGPLVVAAAETETGLSTFGLHTDDGDRLWTYEGAFPLAAVGETLYAVGGGHEERQLLALRG